MQERVQDRPRKPVEVGDLPTPATELSPEEAEQVRGGMTELTIPKLVDKSSAKLSG